MFNYIIIKQMSNSAANKQYDYLVQPKKENPFYKTTSQSYNPKWELTQDRSIKDYTVPTFKEILDKR
jgi:hypothetical protein